MDYTVLSVHYSTVLYSTVSVLELAHGVRTIVCMDYTILYYLLSTVYCTVLELEHGAMQFVCGLYYGLLY